MDIVEKVKNAGVVGAGGAGFPAWRKIGAKADYLVANGAECEPLLRVDQQLMIVYAKEIVDGMRLIMDATGAERGVIALKAKYEKAILALEGCLDGSGISLHILENYYPAGDEQALVADVTGRIVPEGGIPIDIGVVVQNVGTLRNIALADKGQPVTDRWLTVAGAVSWPRTINVPVGTPVAECINAAGGATAQPVTVLDGGPMMGNETGGVVTKTTTSLIVLPSDHKLVRYKNKSIERDIKIARSACEGCRFCTDMCPRFLLGHKLEPHAIMQAVAYQAPEEVAPEVIAQAYLCCQCGLCGMFACPLMLSPERVIRSFMDRLKRAGIKPLYRRSDLEFHPERNYRRPPVHDLVSRLELEEYDRDAPIELEKVEVGAVRIPLKQHVGAPAEPVVEKGEKVKSGQLIADMAEGQLGAPVHASISGSVVSVNEGNICIGA